MDTSFSTPGPYSSVPRPSQCWSGRPWINFGSIWQLFRYLPFIRHPPLFTGPFKCLFSCLLRNTKRCFTFSNSTGLSWNQIARIERPQNAKEILCDAAPLAALLSCSHLYLYNKPVAATHSNSVQRISLSTSAALYITLHLLSSLL